MKTKKEGWKEDEGIKVKEDEDRRKVNTDVKEGEGR
jgi:hypothetical protein